MFHITCYSFRVERRWNEMTQAVIEERAAKALACTAIGHVAGTLMGNASAGRIVGFIVSLFI
jgi:hypothetical protein